jgi:hypothetical protein
LIEESNMMSGFTASIATETASVRDGWSGPQRWLRLEGLAVLVTAVALYAQGDYSWWLFAVLLLAPDLAMVGYLANPRLGAQIYNGVHSYAVVLVSLGIGYFTATPWLLAVSLIWLAHVGMDRTVGYGLKYSDQFKHTHLDEV